LYYAWSYLGRGEFGSCSVNHDNSTLFNRETAQGKDLLDNFM